MSTEIEEGKVIFVGDTNVGKTSLLYALLGGDFQESRGQTVNPGFETLNEKDSNGKPRRIQLWDTSGQERYQSISKLFLRQADIAVVCFDSSVDNSMQTTSSWVQLVKQESPLCRFIIVGTKSDLIDENESMPILNQADSYFDDLSPIQILLTSSKSTYNIKMLKKLIVNEIGETNHDTSNSVSINEKGQNEGGCC